MNENEIRNMEAGREMDALVAEKVFGCDPLNARHGLKNYSTGEYELAYYWGYPVGHTFAPHYSTDISAAWEVVEKISETVGPTSVCWGIYGGQGNKASVAMMYHDGPGVVAPTAPLAICRAALLAVMGDGE